MLDGRLHPLADFQRGSVIVRMVLNIQDSYGHEPARQKFR